MRILIATGIYPPDIGGPATYSALMRERLPECGISVKILSFGEVRYLPKVIRHIVFIVKAVRRSIGCDIIYAQDPVSVGLPALIASKILFKKFFIRVAGDYAWEQAVQRYGIKDNIDDFQKKRYGLKTEFLRRVESFVVGRAHTVITPSIYFRDLVSNWNKKQKRVFHIYNGIEFPDNLKERSVAKRELNIPQDSKVIVTAGRLVPWKGYVQLIDVVRDLLVKDKTYRLYILGAGPDKEALKKQIENNDLQNNVFLVGAVPRETVFAYLSAGDIFVLNTSFESFSFQIVEAMYAGIAVISTNIGNIPEIVTDKKEGILIKPNDKIALEKNILHIMNNPEIKRKMIEFAKEKSKQFSIQNTIAKVCSIMKDDEK